MKFRTSYLAQKNKARFIRKSDVPKFRAKGFSIKAVKTPLVHAGGRPKYSQCPRCDVTEYRKNTKFTCVKCGWKTIIEKDKKGRDIQIN